MDRWMIRFLLEHSSDLEERTTAGGASDELPGSVKSHRAVPTSERTLMADDVVAYLRNHDEC